MIILITGASHTGKTLLAQRMLEMYHYPYLSIDHLKMGLIRSQYTTLTPEDDDDLTDCLWPIVREMMKTAIENQQNLIIEGCYVPFDWRQDFAEAYLNQIHFVCLSMTDAYINAHLSEIRKYADAIEHRLDDGECTSDRFKADNRAYSEGFRRYGEQIAWIDDDYSTAIEIIMERFNPIVESQSKGKRQ